MPVDSSSFEQNLFILLEVKLFFACKLFISLFFSLLALIDNFEGIDYLQSYRKDNVMHCSALFLIKPSIKLYPEFFSVSFNVNNFYLGSTYRFIKVDITSTWFSERLKGKKHVLLVGNVFII